MCEGVEMTQHEFMQVDTSSENRMDFNSMKCKRLVKKEITMKKKNVLFMCLVLLVAMSIIPTGARAYELITKTETVIIEQETIELKKIAENFIIICDTSQSMSELYKKTGQKKIVLQKEILKSRNEALPNLGFNGGLYGYDPKALTPTRTTNLKTYLAVKPYDKKEFAEAIGKLPIDAEGLTPLEQALSELDPVLASLKGHTVVFVVTDGSYTKYLWTEKPIDTAKKLAQKYDVSFFVIDSSGKEKNQPFEYLVNSINARSRVISFDQFLEDPLFLSGALFVLDIRMVKKAKDIEKVIGIKLSNALFAFDSAEIDPKYTDALKKLGDYMQNTPQARLALSAFTDNVGPSSYNLELSRRRVESIASYLENNYKIKRTRMALNYYGEANPVASNDTDEGRAKNRRVEAFIFGL
jgi:OOP family OmpA-OmpF porin